MGCDCPFVTNPVRLAMADLFSIDVYHAKPTRGDTGQFLRHVTFLALAKVQTITPSGRNLSRAWRKIVA